MVFFCYNRFIHKYLAGGANMRIVYKLLLSVVSVAGLIISLWILSWCTSIPYLSDTAHTFLSSYPWLSYVAAAFCIVLCVVFLLLLLTAILIPSRRTDLTFAQDRGLLQFSKQTIESTARYSFADIEGIVLSKVRTRIGRQPEKTRIYVKLAVSDSSKLMDLTQSVQQRIETALSNSLGITIKAIDIKVVEHRPDQENREHTAFSEPSVQNSRVL